MKKAQPRTRRVLTPGWDFPVAKQSQATASKKVEVRINPELNEAVVDFLRLSDAVKEYANLKSQVEYMETRLKQVRAPIEEALAIHGEPIEIAGFNCSMRIAERENFALKEAKKHIDMKLLKPYLSRTTFTQLYIKGVKE